MKKYLEVLNDIIENGNKKTGRNGVTRSIFGTQIRYNLLEGFPILTTKKVNFANIAKELLWFLSGNTNNEDLRAMGCKIWDQWAYPENETKRIFTDKGAWVKYIVETAQSLWSELVVREASDFTTSHEELHVTTDLKNTIGTALTYYASTNDIDLLYRVLTSMSGYGNIPNWDAQIPAVGELGPVYGAMWRNWPTSDGKTIDQIKEIIESLKKSPDSRRMLVTGWNPELLPVESDSHETNIENGKQVLPPCHALAQFYTSEIPLKQRCNLMFGRLSFLASGIFIDNSFDYERTDEEGLSILKVIKETVDSLNVPTRYLSCQLYQRSADWPVGVPYNIASYALLTHMIAQCVGMTAYEFIHTTGDTHVYADQVELAKEQVTRSPSGLPALLLNREITDIDSFTIDDMQLFSYKSQDHIPYPVAS